MNIFQACAQRPKRLWSGTPRDVFCNIDHLLANMLASAQWNETLSEVTFYFSQCFQERNKQKSFEMTRCTCSYLYVTYITPLQGVPDLRGFWDLKKTALREILVSGTVGDPLLTQKSPSCAYISQKSR